MAGIGTAVGAEKVLAKLTQGFGKEVKAVAVGNQVTIYEDGKAIQNFTLPEDAVAVWEFSEGTIRLNRTITKQELAKEQAEHESEKNRLLDIARKDSRIAELIKGKEHRIIGVGILSNDTLSNRTAELTLEVDGNMALGVEGKYYKVTIDLNSETVTSITQLKSERIDDGIKISYGEQVQ
jgi:hypothetical protein